MLKPEFQEFESLVAISGKMDKPCRYIKVEGVEYRAVSSTHNSIALFFEDGKAWFRYDLRVHSNDNLKAFEATSLPREIKVFVSLDKVFVDVSV